jgi:hypothetical protein
MKRKKPLTKAELVAQQAAQQKEKQQTFLAAYLREGTIYHACLAADIGRRTHYDWVKKDAVYKKLFEEAQACYLEILEREADRRAREGTEIPVGFYKDIPGAYVKEYSDTLLMFRLKRRDPEYRERVDVSHSGTLGVWRVDAYRPKKPDNKRGNGGDETKKIEGPRSSK